MTTKLRAYIYRDFFQRDISSPFESNLASEAAFAKNEDHFRADPPTSAHQSEATALPTNTGPSQATSVR